jgi:hypothetical protein
MANKTISEAHFPTHPSSFDASPPFFRKLDILCESSSYPIVNNALRSYISTPSTP